MNETSKEVGHRAGEGRASCNLGNAYESLGDFQKAIEYHEQHLKISKEVGDRAGEGKAYCYLSNAYNSLIDFQKAKEYHKRHFKISKEVRDRTVVGGAYFYLENACPRLGNFQKAKEYHERDLKISKEEGDPDVRERGCTRIEESHYGCVALSAEKGEELVSCEMYRWKKEGQQKNGCLWCSHKQSTGKTLQSISTAGTPRLVA